MGCGASKGKSDEGGNTESADIEFKHTDVWSVDDFFNQAKRTLDAFKDITGPLQEQKDKFFEATGFYEVPGAGKYLSPPKSSSEFLKWISLLLFLDKNLFIDVKHAFLGMFLSLSALCNVIF